MEQGGHALLQEKEEGEGGGDAAKAGYPEDNLDAEMDAAMEGDILWWRGCTSAALAHHGWAEDSEEAAVLLEERLRWDSEEAPFGQ